MVLRLIAPRIMSSVIFAINIVAIGSIATELGTGSASAFEWGIRIMDIPEALIGTAIGLVLLPTLSALSELKKIDERRQIFSEALRFICVAAIPAAAGMMLIGKPALYTLFPEERTVQVETVDESNEQTDFETSSATTQENSEDEDEEATASADLIYAVVQILAFAVIFQSLHEIVTRAFYAEKDTWIPLLASFWGMIGNFLVLGIGFGLYRNLDLPLAGPLGVGLTGLGYTVSFLIELAFLIMVLRNRWNDIDAPRILNTVSLTLIATFIMAIPVFGIDYFLARNIFTEGTRVAGILRAGIGTLVGGVVFLGAALWLDLHEIKQLPKLFRRSRQAETVL
jgi:peptidoglycan biosynthesis protein MviN/MurJ (putative lipid II flippase)